MKRQRVIVRSICCCTSPECAIGELCALEDPYVKLRERQAQMLGKGNRWRPIFWQPPGAVALIRYVLLRRGPRDRGALFRGTSQRNDGVPMTDGETRSWACQVSLASRRSAI
jgi:hypothetical protein